MSLLLTLLTLALPLAALDPPAVSNPPAVSDPPAVVLGTDAKLVRARPFVMTYRAVFKRVAAGEAVKLAVGRDEPGYERVDDAPPGVKPGLYRCWPGADGEPKWERVEPILPRLFDPPVIPRPAPVRSPST